MKIQVSGPTGIFIDKETLKEFCLIDGESVTREQYEQFKGSKKNDKQN